MATSLHGDNGGAVFCYVLVDSGFGELSIVWRQTERGPRVCRVFLPRPGTSAHHLAQAAFPQAGPCSIGPIERLAEQVGRFLEGEVVHFDLSILELGRCSDFQTCVLLAESQIPRGWVSTYGRIARHLDIPGGARAVGGALARNPFPIIIPCHRAIRSDGSLGGFQGGPDMKRALLEFEGVEFSSTGRVAAERFYY
jgi:methylated-DNA-[protein]-cysteine S-methyltransferase